MKEVLETLNKTKGVIGSLVVGEDGIIVLSDIPNDFDKEFVAALIASAVDAGTKAISGINNDDLELITIEGDSYLLMITATKIGFLTLVSKAQSNLGLIRVEIKRAKYKFNEI